MLCSSDINIRLRDNTDEISIERILFAVRTSYAQLVVNCLKKNEKAGQKQKLRTKKEILDEQSKKLGHLNSLTEERYELFLNFFMKLYQVYKVNVNYDSGEGKDYFVFEFHNLTDEEFKFLKGQIQKIPVIHGRDCWLALIPYFYLDPNNRKASIKVRNISGISIIFKEFISDKLLEINECYEQLADGRL